MGIVGPSLDQGETDMSVVSGTDAVMTSVSYARHTCTVSCVGKLIVGL